MDAHPGIGLGHRFTWEEHQKLLAREKDPEKQAFFELLWHVAQRADRFHTRCKSLGISGVSMHSYRYAWAERAAEAGYPERYAQQALRHASAAIHRAYAKKARVELPPLGEFEKRGLEGKVIPLQLSDEVTSIGAAANVKIVQ